MKKLYLSAIMAAMATTAFAIPSPIPTADELPEFDQFDTAIEIPSYADRVIYKYNPETPGTLTTYVKNGDGSIFVSATYYQDSYTLLGGNYGTGPVENVLEGYDYGFAYPMTPDIQYYIAIPLESYNTATEVYFTWDASEITETSITSVTPAPAATSFDYVTNVDIVVQASEGISSFGDVTITYGDTTLPIEGCHLQGPTGRQLLSIAIAAIGQPNYAKMAADAGETSFTINITKLYSNGVPVTENATGNDNVVVEDGNVTLTYAVAQAPTYLADESTWPATFYSYWEKGDEDAIATLVFDQPISKVNQVTVIMAHVVPNDEGSGEQVSNSYIINNVKCDGNKAIIDFSGIEYYGSTRDVTVMVQTVMGENGLPAYMNGSLTLFKYIPYSSEAAPTPGTDAVSTIATELKDAAVYDLNGVKVNGTVDTLPAGIYVINGKKVVIR